MCCVANQPHDARACGDLRDLQARGAPDRLDDDTTARCAAHPEPPRRPLIRFVTEPDAQGTGSITGDLPRPGPHVGLDHRRAASEERPGPRRAWVIGLGERPAGCGLGERSAACGLGGRPRQTSVGRSPLPRALRAACRCRRPHCRRPHAATEGRTPLPKAARCYRRPHAATMGRPQAGLETTMPSHGTHGGRCVGRAGRSVRSPGRVALRLPAITRSASCCPT